MSPTSRAAFRRGRQRAFRSSGRDCRSGLRSQVSDPRIRQLHEACSFFRLQREPSCVRVFSSPSQSRFFPSLASRRVAAAAAARRRPPVRRRCSFPTASGTAIDATPHEGWVVLVRGERIEAVGPHAQVSAPADATTISLPGTTLIPGLIEGHSHLLLHPYNETSWNDQVLHEPLALRVARAVNHAQATLLAGFTTVRDLGTEGAGYADVGLKQAINQGIIPGPRMVVDDEGDRRHGQLRAEGIRHRVHRRDSAGRRGGRRPRQDQPRRARPDQARRRLDQGLRGLPLGPERRSDARVHAGRAESHRRRSRRARAARSPRTSTTAEGMRRATLAGVATIEHGDGGTPEVFKLMAERGVCYVPTVSVGSAKQAGGAADWRWTPASRSATAPTQARSRTATTRKEVEGLVDERTHAAAGTARRDRERREDAPLGGSHRRA